MRCGWVRLAVVEGSVDGVGEAEEEEQWSNAKAAPRCTGHERPTAAIGWPGKEVVQRGQGGPGGPVGLSGCKGSSWRG